LLHMQDVMLDSFVQELASVANQEGLRFDLPIDDARMEELSAGTVSLTHVEVTRAGWKFYGG